MEPAWLTGKQNLFPEGGVNVHTLEAKPARRVARVKDKRYAECYRAIE